jgi:formylglycine-generating enzyme required for sulfatase activity
MRKHSRLSNLSAIVLILTISVSINSPSAFCQTDSAAHKAEKWVVLIGVDQYQFASPLEYAVADQQSLYDELVSSGLDERQVTLLRDKADDSKYLPFKSNIEREIKGISSLAERGDLVLIVFSGHGRHIGKKSYICPTDANLDDPETMIALEWIYDQLRPSKADLKMVIVDACRDVDPLLTRDKNGSVPDYQTEMKSFVSSSDRLPNGMILLHSCSEGEKAKEDKALGHGVFTYYLLEGLRGKADKDKNGRVTMGELMSFSNRETKLHVYKKSGSIQSPKVFGNFAFDVLDFEVVSLSGPKVLSPTTAKPVMNVADAPRKPLPLENPAGVITNSIGMKLKLIPAGEFLMGSPTTEKGRSEDEGPQHKVRITKPFYLGVTEVTQGEWFAVMQTRPWAGQNSVKEGNTYPATYVSWDDAHEYCRRLSEKEGKLYRLPTESEWEYACRGGTTTAYSYGPDSGLLKDYAWFGATALDIGEGYAHEVGMKKANPFGLHDMHGNVWEWCSDWKADYSAAAVTDPMGPSAGSYRVDRGGSWRSTAGLCRSAYRSGDDPSFRYGSLGFRLALSPTGP